MDWNLITGLVYGFISGFTGLLPVSAEGHQILFRELTGIATPAVGFRLASHIAMLTALLVLMRPQLMRFRRERKLASVPVRRGRRQPDVLALKEDRFWRTSLIPACLVTVGFCFLRPYVQSLLVLAILIFCCGLLLYFPQFYRRGNKAAETVSGLDGFLLGIGSGIASVPGLSGFAGGLFASSLRGLDNRFAVDNCLMTLLAVLPVMIGYDLYEIIFLEGAMLSAGWLLLYLTAALAAFGGGVLAVKLVRFLSVRVGFSGFAYYCWGLSIFTFALYLIV